MFQRITFHTSIQFVSIQTLLHTKELKQGDYIKNNANQMFKFDHVSNCDAYLSIIEDWYENGNIDLSYSPCVGDGAKIWNNQVIKSFDTNCLTCNSSIDKSSDQPMHCQQCILKNKQKNADFWKQIVKLSNKQPKQNRDDFDVELPYHK